MGLQLPDIKEIATRHRGAAIAAAAGVVFFIILFTMLGKYASANRALAIKKTELERFTSLSKEYLARKAVVDIAARRARLSTDQAGSAIGEIERIGGMVGAKELITSIKPLEERKSGGYTEKEFEVRMERLELNSLVNMLYLIENNNRLFVIREFSMKSRFEDPDLLDVRLKVAQLTRTE